MANSLILSVYQARALNLKTSPGNTVIVPVRAGAKFVITRAWGVVLTAVSVTVPPVVSITANALTEAGAEEILTSNEGTDPDSAMEIVDKVSFFIPFSPPSKICDLTNSIKVYVQSAATGTSMTADIFVEGHYL